MQPSDKLAEVIRITRLCCKACGADVSDPNYKINVVTYFVFFCITIYFTFTYYTAQLNFENWKNILETLCMIGGVLQGISKLLSGIFFTKNISAQCTFMMSLYVEYEVKGKDYNFILNKCISRVRRVLLSVGCIYIALVLSLIAVPIYQLYFNGQRIFVMHFYVPLLDPNTNFGYFGTIAVQTTCLLILAFGNYAADMFVLVFFAHILLYLDIFKMKTAELNNVAGSPGTMEKLHDVVEWHKTYSYVTVDCECTLYWINFVQITTSGLSIVLTLLVIFIADWPGAYTYLLLSFTTLYLYCGLGTIVEVAVY